MCALNRSDADLDKTNLHADTLEQTRDQLCRENGVAPAHLDAVTLKVYPHMGRTKGWAVRRWVSHVYESDGAGDRLLWTGDRDGMFSRLATSRVVSPGQENEYADLLSGLRRQDVRHTSDVRRALLNHQ